MVLSTKFGSAEFQDIKKLLHAVSLMNSTITFPAMGRIGTLKVRFFGDAAFGNIPDKDPSKDKVYSTVGKLISWSSKKASRVAKSALAAEVMAASEACDEGHWVRHILEQLPMSKVFTLPLSATTDSESLSAALKTTNTIQDKRSRIEVGQLREGLDLKDILTKEIPAINIAHVEDNFKVLKT